MTEKSPRDSLQRARAAAGEPRPPGHERMLAALRASAPADPSTPEWNATLAALRERAAGEGLVDVAIERHDSPLGPLLLGATDQGIVRLGLPIEDEEAVLDELAARVSPRVLRASRPALTDARHQLDEYFEGTRHDFVLPLDWQLTTGFRRAVLHATAAIPYGQTAAYRDIATGAGRPAAVRAAGTALAANPIPIIVPCHRVLRSGGALGSYRGGPDAKAQLLTLEGGWAPPSPAARR